MTHIIETIFGPIEPVPMGTCLIHEHLFIDYGELIERPRQLPDRGSEREQQIVALIEVFRDAGGALLVDCTPPGYGRSPDLMATVSTEANVHIVACTGGFTEQWAPIHPIVRTLDVEALTDFFIRELNEGMDGTRYRAGAIKVATGKAGMSELEAHIFRAAARAHRATGAPLITHTTAGLGPQQLEFLLREGVDPSRVVIGHLGFEENPRADIAAILEHGAYVAFDHIGHQHFFPDSHWVDLVRYALERGGAERVVLSHTAVAEVVGPDAIKAHTFSNYAYIPTLFLPQLQDAAVDPHSISLMTRENPQRVLAYREPQGGA